MSFNDLCHVSFGSIYAQSNISSPYYVCQANQYNVKIFCAFMPLIYILFAVFTISSYFCSIIKYLYNQANQGDIMVFNKEKITDGIYLSVMPSEKFKAGVIAFSLTVPLTRCGSAYSNLLSGLLRRGTQKYPSMASLNRRLDELYGSYVEVKSHRIGDNLSITIICEVLDNKYIPDGTDALGGVIDIISDMLLNPTFLQEDFDTTVFEQEKRVILDALNAEINNTRVYAIRRCTELMYEGNESHPTVAQSKKIVENATIDDVKQHYYTLLSSAPLEIFYIGATPTEQIKTSLLHSFSTHTFCTGSNIRPALPVRRNSFSQGHEPMPVSQGKLAMSFSTGICINAEDDSYYVALMLNEIFGGSASSKLFCNVREKMSLCYYCSSSFSTYSGLMTVSSGMEVKNFELVRSAILDQLDQIRRGNITEQELAAAKKSIINAYRQLYDSPFDLQSFYSGRMIFSISDTVDDCIRKLEAVTVDRIVDIAGKISLDALFFVEGRGEGPDEEDENE